MFVIIFDQWIVKYSFCEFYVLFARQYLKFFKKFLMFWVKTVKWEAALLTYNGLKVCHNGFKKIDKKCQWLIFTLSEILDKVFDKCRTW